MHVYAIVYNAQRWLQARLAKWCDLRTVLSYKVDRARGAWDG